ncbi:MAG: GNAT family N-acetyltransferase [Deltaproteobacteria bacterium]|nr:GNAT family N-acetyltransferase [Deltaproteobacteria bacterium]MBW2070192.1 GNAT family N-acetyltransferase [Deltaproteobacteria bacterium]
MKSGPQTSLSKNASPGGDHAAVLSADYQKKKTSAERAMARIRRGNRVFIGSGCGEPQHLVRALERMVVQLADLEILHLLSLGKASFTEEAFRDKCRLKSFFVASGSRQAVAEGRADYTPIYLYDVPQLFRSGHSPIDVALIQVSPPDPHGYCSYGISVDIVKAAAEEARIVIAQINPRMPRVHGDAYIHIDQIDAVVEHREELLEMPPPLMNDTAYEIGREVAELIDDGSTIRAGVGSVANAALYSLADKKDLGVHTDMLTDAFLYLIEKGAITNRKKTLHPKKVVASFCMGSRRLYDFVEDNPMVAFYPAEYTNDYFVISKNDNMVCINSALQVDLSGQVCADSVGHTIYSGVGGAVDFIRGALLSKNGKSIIVLPSTTLDEEESRIVPHLSEGAGVINTRGGVHYIVTEYGAVNLHGKSIRERALALIELAHPKFREQLFRAAQRLHYIYRHLQPPKGAPQPYPETWQLRQVLAGGEEIRLRPVRLTDERALQEFFYALPQEKPFIRFLSAMKVFPRPDLRALLQIDYHREMCLVAVTGELAAETVVAVGRYLLDEETNMAEVDFAVRQQWQGKGVASLLLQQLINIAKSKHIEGFVTYLDPGNRQALAVFQKMGYLMNTSLEGDVMKVTLSLTEPVEQCFLDFSGSSTSENQ